MAFDYFAYASNMAPDVIMRLCPEHRYPGVAHGRSSFGVHPQVNED
jgi:hypothetical protein